MIAQSSAAAAGARRMHARRHRGMLQGHASPRGRMSTGSTTTHQRADRHWAHLALAALSAFVFAACALHLRRGDLDPVAHPMSLYLIGDWGAALQAAYVALGLAMVGLGWGLYRSLAAPARSAAPLVLFALAAASLSTTAYAWMDLPGVDASLEGLVHGISAQAAFLFATTALVLQALRLRHDPAWRRDARWLLPWALACFAAIWVLALGRDLPRGLAQKTVIAMIVGWLGTVALLLRGRGERR